MGPADVRSTDIEAALAALEASGARAFDAASCDCARSLLGRAGDLPLRARELLLDRVQHHIERLSTRLRESRAQAEQRLRRVEQRHGHLPSLRGAIERGELIDVRRTLRRLDGTPAREERRIAIPERGAREYEAAFAELAASFVVAEAVDTVPENAGPYNSLRIATDLLACIGEVSPLYLTAQLTRLDELGRMLLLPEVPIPGNQPPAPAPRKSRGVGKTTPGTRRARVRRADARKA